MPEPTPVVRARAPSWPTNAQGGPSREGAGPAEVRPAPPFASPRARPRGPLQTLAFARPRCPRCCGAALLKYRTISDQGDGSALWWVCCKGCGHRFKVLLE